MSKSSYLRPKTDFQESKRVPCTRSLSSRFATPLKTGHRVLLRTWKKMKHCSGVDSEARQSKFLERAIAEDTHTLCKANIAEKVDERDTLTPDHWIKRSKGLLRLTGRHPFNAEPSISVLYDEGFITPVSLHFVRNHGRSAEMDPNSYRLIVDGLVRKELSLSLRDIKKFPNITMPVTLCCSANRRKELNTISKTNGFNWTTAANSTNMWKGVLLADVLKKAGVNMRRARYVLFEGSKFENLPKDLYATSVDVLTAVNPFDHILLAWQQNGIDLHPDHGYPLRVIVPGYVGGRSVKWLERITVSTVSSDNFYHFHDNRILPSFVDAQRATDEGWWFREEFIYNQLNVNSTIVHPTHEQILPLSSEIEECSLKGFALSGGGRKVTRVEITLDNGKNWRLCEVQYPEEKFSEAPTYGRYYCWMFFSIKISVKDLIKTARGTGEIRSRAWDSSSNTQPFEQNWNVLGHGNNSQFRLGLRILKKESNETIQFLHPVAPGDQNTGWMEIKKEENIETEKKSTIDSDPDTNEMCFGRREISKHRAADDCWIIVDNGVYDATRYLNDHPGGVESILLNAGTDCSREFNAIHSKNAKTFLKQFRIGSLKKKVFRESNMNLATDFSPVTATIGSFDNLRSLKMELIEREDLNESTRLYSFSLQSADRNLMLPVGNHVVITALVNGEQVTRAYTPISYEKETGRISFCIKTYFAGLNENYPEGGKMTTYLERIKIGELVEMKGPLGGFEYRGFGNVKINGVKRKITKIGMICGGTGITPAYQIVSNLYNNSADQTVINILYACNSYNDILMRDELLEMSERSNIHIWFSLFIADDEWKMSKGFVTKSMVANHIPPPSEGTIVGVCGPPAMIKDTCVPILTDLKYDEKDIILF